MRDKSYIWIQVRYFFRSLLFVLMDSPL